MDRKAMAQETLRIIRQGSYATEKGRIEIKEAVERSVRDSVLISPEEGERILAKFSAEAGCGQPETRVENISTVEAVRLLAAEGRTDIGVLNFASAKNPGGGFLNGAKAQEESLTVSGALYPTLTAHPEYYEANRANRSMMYLDYGIYSPEVVLFRDGAFRLTDTPVRADVLTLPAVNMGQVLLKGEDAAQARRVMRRRMKLALGIFAEKGGKAPGARGLWLRRVPQRPQGDRRLVAGADGGGHGAAVRVRVPRRPGQLQGAGVYQGL